MGAEWEQTNAEQGVANLHAEPPSYTVLLHNDDYTTMDFVVEILQQVFQKPFEEAFRIMRRVHEQGIGVCGSYTREIAEARVAMVKSLAEANGFPLLCTMEREE
ncbi:MAG: ATP-dependent Clp protease adaptor ClpS [Spirochaetota bacterium]|jgi:ATP-dependent Clp protease adaptor protein ClpS|nr:ATP-dependent Clp protease adaptor ClpS [Spirochaetota bacterium]